MTKHSITFFITINLNWPSSEFYTWGFGFHGNRLYSTMFVCGIVRGNKGGEVKESQGCLHTQRFYSKVRVGFRSVINQS